MAIPDYQTLMLPLLRAVEDGRDHSLRDVATGLAQEFGITREEERELLPSGKQTVFLNRVGWARTYMKKAALVEGWSRGQLRITEEGTRVLAKAPRAHRQSVPEALPGLPRVDRLHAAHRTGEWAAATLRLREKAAHYLPAGSRQPQFLSHD